MKFLRRLWMSLQWVLKKQSIDEGWVVLKFDGGICSQIGFYALAKDLETKGFRVKYDLSWYAENGLDMDGVHARNFDMRLAFPNLDLSVATPLEVFHYRRLYSLQGNSLEALSTPAYLGGYYDRWPLVIKHGLEILEDFKPKLEGAKNLELEGLIRASKRSCAVHLRRGDLATFNPVYGEPLTADYYVQAIRMIYEKAPNTTFFFFSDEPSWVKDEVLVHLDERFDCVEAFANTSDKGYLDLYLMTLCDSYIASQGSMAKYARVLSGNRARIVEPCSRAVFDASDSKAFQLN